MEPSPLRSLSQPPSLCWYDFSSLPSLLFFQFGYLDLISPPLCSPFPATLLKYSGKGENHEKFLSLLCNKDKTAQEWGSFSLACQPLPLPRPLSLSYVKERTEREKGGGGGEREEGEYESVEAKGVLFGDVFFGKNCSLSLDEVEADQVHYSSLFFSFFPLSLLGCVLLFVGRVMIGNQLITTQHNTKTTGATTSIIHLHHFQKC